MSAEKKDISKTDLNSLVLREEQLSSGEYQAVDIFYLTINEIEYGPLLADDIKNYLQENEELEESTTMVRNVEESHSCQVFGHPQFQRRGPSLVSEALLSDTAEEFYLLLNGQKAGPYNHSEIDNLLMTKQLILTDAISIDNGESWGKVYEVEDFDRRSISNENLPHRPDNQVFLNSDKSTQIRLLRGGDVKTNLVAGLAYIGNLQTGNAVEYTKSENIIKEEEHIEAQEEDLTEEVVTQKSNTLSYLLFGAGVIGFIILYLTATGTKTNSFQSTSKSKMKIVKKLSPVKLKPVNSKRRALSSGLRINKTAVTKRQKSLMRSKAFQKAKRRARARTKFKKLSENPLIERENVYYDDASDPVELDPIRRTLSKETLDPEFSENEFINDDEFQDAPEGDILDGEINY